MENNNKNEELRPLETVGKFLGGLVGDIVEVSKSVGHTLSELPETLEKAGKDIADATAKGYDEGLMVTPEDKPSEDTDKDSPSRS